MPPASSVTILIPVYNEGKIITQTLETLCVFLKKSAFPYHYDIVVVDNASTDDIAQRVRDFSAGHPEVTLLTVAEKGKGRAIRAGWARSSADILTFMDADLASDLASFKPLVDAVASGSADIAIGNRLGARSKIV